MDAKQVRSDLAAAGFHLASQGAQIEAREDCWAVSLSGERMAWFPMNAVGLQRLATERRVLRLLQARCSFQVPRVLFVAEAGWEVRALVPGVCDPWELFQQAQNDRSLARRIGRSLGGILAEQHARVRPEDAAGWLPDHLAWPSRGNGSRTGCQALQQTLVCGSESAGSCGAAMIWRAQGLPARCSCMAISACTTSQSIRRRQPCVGCSTMKAQLGPTGIMISGISSSTPTERTCSMLLWKFMSPL